MKVEIYQVRDDLDEQHDIMFLNYEHVKLRVQNLKKNFKDYYKKTYEYNETFEQINTSRILESIYERFNIDRPDDFRGHSLSVSDIVILDDEMYFCDSIGFTKIE